MLGQLGESLYSALHRFKKRGWVNSYWRATENNRIARHYQRTTEARHALAEDVEEWRLYAATMNHVIDVP